MLDASAVLAVVNVEPGAQRVEVAFLEGASMSTVNLAEVATKLAERGVIAAEAEETLAPFEIAVEVFTTAQAYRAGALRRSTIRLGLSLGDRACVALAETLGLPVLTADRRWADLDPALGVEVRLVR